MNRSRQDLPTLLTTGEVQASLEDRRWFIIGLLLLPLIGLTASYVAELRQPVQEAYVIYLYPVSALLLSGGVVWNLLRGPAVLTDRLGIGLVGLAVLGQNVGFALEPHLPDHNLFVNTGPYWGVAMAAGAALIQLPLRPATRLVVGYFALLASLPWLLNAHAFLPHAAPLIRAQSSCLTVLLGMISLAWYRMRFTERATEALLLRELALTDLFAPLPGESSGVSLAGLLVPPESSHPEWPVRETAPLRPASQDAPRAAVGE
ncbi:hypothetical protein [Deinococcus sp. UYEF24]